MIYSILGCPLRVDRVVASMCSTCIGRGPLNEALPLQIYNRAVKTREISSCRLWLLPQQKLALFRLPHAFLALIMPAT